MMMFLRIFIVCVWICNVYMYSMRIKEKPDKFQRWYLSIYMYLSIYILCLSIYLSMYLSMIYAYFTPFNLLIIYIYIYIYLSISLSLSLSHTHTHTHREVRDVIYPSALTPLPNDRIQSVSVSDDITTIIFDTDGCVSEGMYTHTHTYTVYIWEMDR